MQYANPPALKNALRLRMAGLQITEHAISRAHSRASHSGERLRSLIETGIARRRCSTAYLSSAWLRSGIADAHPVELDVRISITTAAPRVKLCLSALLIKFRVDSTHNVSVEVSV